MGREEFFSGRDLMGDDDCERASLKQSETRTLFRLLGQELNRQLAPAPGSFVEIRATRASDFDVARGQHLRVAEQIPGSRVEVIGGEPLRRFLRTGEMDPSWNPTQREMAQNARADTTGLGAGDFRTIVRIIR
jgi:hypothetical protein